MNLKYKLFFSILFIFNSYSMEIVSSNISSVWNFFFGCKYCPNDGPFKYDEPYNKERLLQNSYWQSVSKLTQKEKDKNLLTAIENYDNEVMQEQENPNIKKHVRDHIAGSIAAGACSNFLQSNVIISNTCRDPEDIILAFKVAKNSDYELLKFLLDNKADISTIFPCENGTIFHYTRNLKIARLLQQYLPDKFFKSKKLTTKHLQSLLKQILDPEKNSPFYYPDYETSLLDFYINIFKIDVNNFDLAKGNSPLKHLALNYKDYVAYPKDNNAVKTNEYIKKRLRKKVQILLNNNADTALEIGKKPLTQFLAREKSDTPAKSILSTIENFIYVRKKLIESIEQTSAQTDSLQQIIQMGQDLNYIIDKHGNTILHLAVKLGNIPAIIIILKNKPGLLSVKNKNGKSPIHIAGLERNLAVTKLLIGVYPPIILTADGEGKAFFENFQGQELLIKMIHNSNKLLTH